MTSDLTPDTPQPPATRLERTAFAFPFLRGEPRRPGAAARFDNEHDIHRLLAGKEPSGAYLVSRKGMWHGGIHITEAGAGQALDLDAGLRCIADGVLIAYRVNGEYPVSELSLDGENLPFQAPYSTGFALVRHELEFPRSTKLTFYSLYMHLMSNADYDLNFPKRDKPAYWPRQWQVTQYAQDKPLPGRGGQTADALQLGLNVRKTPNGPVLGVLPHGARVTIGKLKKAPGGTWGQVTNLEDATLYPYEADGYVAPAVATNGWIYLGNENGGPVVKASIQDSIFDRIIVTTNPMSNLSDPHGTVEGIPVKAGDLIGHLGRYDSLDRCTVGTRMAHIEVFCDGSIKPFIEAGRAWVGSNGAHAIRWSELGLSADPTILRIDRGATLYRDHGQQGADAKQTDVVQIETFAAMQRDANRQFLETTPGGDGQKRRWWKVDSVDGQRNAISGWVREQSFAGGRITREFPQSWIDFACHDESHDPAHTIFATPGDYVDYALGTERSDSGSLRKLSPLMAAIYRDLCPTGDGFDAADYLCGLGQDTAGTGFPWSAFRASRLIPKHASEWANPEKWQELIGLIEQRTGPKPEHEEEKKRIAKLVWWQEVQTAVPGFPSPDVYHINPIGLVGNFGQGSMHPFITINGQRIELPFLLKSNGLALREEDYANAASELGCEVRAIKAVAKTETGSSGPYFRPGQDLASDDDSVPAILFERHLFHRATQGHYDQSHPHISNPVAGGYGSKAAQYKKLMEAYALDSNAALLSASWGRFQILGSNYRAAGFQSVRDYVASASESEANQLRAFVSFIKADPVLNSAISSRDWHGFASRYNGPAQQGYDETIARNYGEIDGQ
jgi:hypothetical protein